VSIGIITGQLIVKKKRPLSWDNKTFSLAYSYTHTNVHPSKNVQDNFVVVVLAHAVAGVQVVVVVDIVVVLVVVLVVFVVVACGFRM